MKWLQVTLRVPVKIKNKTPLIEYIFYQAGFKGLVLKEEKKYFFAISYVNIYNINKLKTLRNFVKTFKLDSKVKISVKEIKESKWATSWKKFFKPIKIGQKFIVAPSWEKVKLSESRIIIKIDPGMAFGTGYHETTCLCLELLEKYLKTRYEVLDLGTGTGILAIAALKLGAEKVLAVDNDKLAVEIARKNIKYNSLRNNFKVNISDGFKNIRGKFNLIIANLTAKEILKLAPEIKNFLLKNGLFICSGIISEDKNKVVKVLKSHKMNLIGLKEKEEWLGLVFESFTLPE